MCCGSWSGKELDTTERLNCTGFWALSPRTLIRPYEAGSICAPLWNVVPVRADFVWIPLRNPSQPSGKQGTGELSHFTERKTKLPDLM